MFEFARKYSNPSCLFVTSLYRSSRPGIFLYFFHILKYLPIPPVSLYFLIFSHFLYIYIYTTFFFVAFFLLSTSALLDEKGVIPQDMVRHLTACIVLGLEALHKCDVLYRALSPELVFLDRRSVCFFFLVADFLFCSDSFFIFTLVFLYSFIFFCHYFFTMRIFVTKFGRWGFDRVFSNHYF